jgi:5'-3' exonuclease
MTIALIDGDLIVYRCSASCEPTKSKPEREPLISALSRADELIYRILNRIAPKEYRVFLGGSENFRKTLSSDYKANRTQPKPEHFDSVRNLLVEEWQAEVCAGYEADDGIGMSATTNTVICSIDKDLRQIPGSHYNFVKDEAFEVSEREAVRNFYTQMLTGDSSDNVRGIDGIGPVRAGRILDGVDPQDMEAVVRNCYDDAGRSREEFLCNFGLLYILREREEFEYIETCFSEGQRPNLTEVSRLGYLKPAPGTNQE